MKDIRFHLKQEQRQRTPGLSLRKLDEISEDLKETGHHYAGVSAITFCSC
ncbi:hypothetical protein DGWBC_0759 [Dehalogenimonas sp. WBC-2]|nr:hypothetical protein DGWBC_0759 [Dehalogenimonas sp. WBC-2]